MTDAGGRVLPGPRLALLPILAVLVSGAAFVLAFPPFDRGGLAWGALVPLLLAAHDRPPREAFWLGYAWGVIALGGVLWWLVAFGAAVWAVAAGLFAVFPAVTMAAVAQLVRTPGGAVAWLGIPVLWTAIEFLRSQGPLGFPWALLGESQHAALLVSQIASVTGIYGITFLVALVNATLYVLLTRRMIVLPLAATGLVMAGVISWGGAALRAPLPATMTAGVVQPDYATRARWHASSAARDLAVLDRLTREAAARGASLVVWPETASPTDIPGDLTTLIAIRSWVQRDRISLVASSLEGGKTNSAFSFAPSGSLVGRYDKARLVPFAEFGEQAGRVSGVLPTPLGGLGVAICFESIFPDISRREVLRGASVLAVITNDAWFDGRAAPAQHAAIAPFRAIEEGRFLLRAANSGWTQIIDPRGRILGDLAFGVRGVLTAPIAPLQDLTPYARLGDVFGWGAVLAGVVLVFPYALGILAGPERTRALLRLLGASALPLGALLAAAHAQALNGPAGVPVAGVILPVPILAVLAMTVVLSRGRSPHALGFRAAGFIPASAVALGVVAALAGMAMLAFSTQGETPAVPPPAGGWWGGTAVQVVVVGLGLEWWLRGLVFAAAVEWRGWKTAVLWSALLGGAAGLPRGAEAMVWGLCSGLAFGLIRARWAQVPALALAHGIGNVLLGFLISPW